MKPYVVSATDRKGRRETFARDAASLDHLRSMLEREGFRDIEPIDDELSATLRTQRSDAGRPRTQAQYQLEAKLRHGPSPIAIWLAAARNGWLFILVTMLTAVFGIWSHRPTFIIAAILVLLFWVLLIRSGMSNADTYNRLLRASASGDWPTAETLIDRMLDSSVAKGNEQIRVDLNFRRACLWARENRLDDALALVEPLRNSPHCRNGMFESRVASIYYSAGRMPEFLHAMEQAFETSGRAQLQRLDLAFAQSRVGEVDQAKELLLGVDQKNLSALHTPVLLAAEGICRGREGDLWGTVERLTRAVAGLSAFAANPATWPFQGMVSGHLAIALSKAGKRNEAKKVAERWHDVILVSLDPESRRILETEVLG